MGYYTNYILEYTGQGDPEIDEKVARALVKHEVLGTSEDLMKMDLDRYEKIRSNRNVYERFVYGLVSGDSYKWYDHEDDMRRVSRDVPDVLFTLWGDGEDWEDRWVLYFKNGAVGGGPAQITVDYPDCHL